MAHDLVFVSADSAQALFECSICHQQIGFVLPGLGEPHAVEDGSSYLPPDNADDYLNPCETPVPIDVPGLITKRQFLIQLLRSGMVQNAEVPTLAIAPPAAITSIFAGLPSEASLEIILTWAAMTEVERHNPLIDMAVQGGLMTNEDLDNFFIAAAQV